MAGREIFENGLPSREEITVYGLGATWTDQQWLAQLFMYGVYSLGGHALLSIATAVFVVSAFAIAIVAARSLGAGPRAIWVMFLPVLGAAPWGWSIRAQMLALPLFTGLLWLLASEARKPSRRIWLALPLLVLWANIHGSVALGALLVMLLCVYELVRSRGRSWLRSVPLLVLAPLAVLVTPYGPIETARYYHLLLVDPPFAGRVTEWSWADPAVNTIFFYGLAVIALVVVWLGRRRLTVFDIAVLALTFAGGVNAIRGIVWFALACMVFVPVAIGRKLESKNQGEPRRRLNVGITVGLCAALLARRGLAVPERRVLVQGLLAARAGGGDPCRVATRGSRVRARPLLGLAPVGDPGASRPDLVRRSFRALRQGVLRRAPGVRRRVHRRLEELRGRIPHRRRGRDPPVAHRRISSRSRARARSTAGTSSRS